MRRPLVKTSARSFGNRMISEGVSKLRVMISAFREVATRPATSKAEEKSAIPSIPTTQTWTLSHELQAIFRVLGARADPGRRAPTAGLERFEGGSGAPPAARQLVLKMGQRPAS